eukprot:g4383.t1
MTNPGATKDKSYSAGKHGAACGTTSDPSKNANDLRVKGDKKIVSKKADTTATFRKKDYFYLKQRRSDPVLILGELFAVLWPEEIADFGMRFDFDIVGEVVRHKKSVRPDVLWSASGALCTVLWRKEPERRVEEEIEQFAATGGAAFDRRPFLFAAFHREYRSFLICAVSASSFSSEKAAGWEHQRRVQECFDRIESSLRETGKMGLFRRRIRVRIPRSNLDAAVQITPLDLMLELGSTEAEAEQQLEHVRSTSTEFPRYDGQEHVGGGSVAAVTATDSHPKITEPKIIHEVEAGAALNSLDWAGPDESEKGIVRNSATTLPNSGGSDGVLDHVLRSGHEKRRRHEGKRESAREKSESVLAPKVVADPFVPTGSPTAGLWATGFLPGSSLPSEQSSAAAPISLSSSAFACVTSMSILWEYWLKQSELVEAGRAQYYCSYGLKSKSAEEAEKPGKEIEMKIALRRLALHLEGYREGDGRVFTLARDVLPMFVHQRGATGSSTVKRENTAASEGGLGLVGTDDASDAAVTNREDGGSGEGNKKESARRRAPPGPSRRILLSKLARDAFLMSPKQGWRIESIEDAATTLGAPPSEFVSYELSFSLITRQLNVSTLSAAMVSLDVDLNRKGKKRANPSRCGVLQQVRALLKQRREERRQRALSMPNRGRVGFLPILNWVQAKVVDLPEAAYSFREIALPSRRLLSYVPPPGCVYDICSGFMSWVSKWMAHSFAARMAGLPDLFARMWERKLEPRPYCAVADVARYGPVWHDDLSALETHTQTGEEMMQNADANTGRGARPDKASPVLQGLQPICVEVFRDLDAQRVMATLMSLSGSSLTEWNERTAVIPALDDAASLSNSPDGRLSLSLPLRTLFVGKDAVYNFCKWKDRCDRRYIPVRAPSVSSSAAVKLQEQESARLEEELRPRLESRSRDAGGGGMGGHKGNKGGTSSLHAAENSTGKKGKQMLSSDCGKGMGKGKEKGGKKGGQEELDPDVDDLPPVVPMFIQDLLDTKFRECCAGGGQQQQAAEEGAVRHSLEDMALLVDYLGVPYCRAPGTKLYCLSILFTGGASVGFLAASAAPAAATTSFAGAIAAINEEAENGADKAAAGSAKSPVVEEQVAKKKRGRPKKEVAAGGAGDENAPPGGAQEEATLEEHQEQQGGTSGKGKRKMKQAAPKAAGARKPSMKKAAQEKEEDDEAEAPGDNDGDEDEDHPNRGRDKIERGPIARNKKRTIADGAWKSMSFADQVADCLARENRHDLYEVFETVERIDRDKKYVLLEAYLQKYRNRFPESAARNAVFRDAEGEVDAEAEAKMAAPGEKIDTAGKKKKARTFMNLGIVSWRPYGKLSRQMRDESGKNLGLLLTTAMEVERATSDGEKEAKDLFVASSITLNKVQQFLMQKFLILKVKVEVLPGHHCWTAQPPSQSQITSQNGTSQMHVDDGNLGHSRVIGFGNYCGGDTWVYDETGTQWLNIKPKSIAGKSVCSTIYNFGWNAERDGKKPFVVRLAEDPDGEPVDATKPDGAKKPGQPIVADRAFFNTDLGRRFRDHKFQMPFKRSPVYHEVQDFMGPWPHATAPAFPKSFVDPAKRPPELRNINILGDMSPDEADFLLQWAADHQSGEDDFIRYVAVFYPHASACTDRIGNTTAELAGGWGFRRMHEQAYAAARKRLEEEYRMFFTKDGFGETKLVGEHGTKARVFKGGKNSLKADKVSAQEEQVKERTRQVLREKYGAEKGEEEIAKIKYNAKKYVNDGGSAQTRDCPLYILNDLWRDWGIPELVEQERQKKIDAGKTPKDKLAYWDCTTKWLREVLRTYAGRKIPEWGNMTGPAGKWPTGNKADGGTLIPYKDWPRDWFFLKDTDLSGLKDAYLKHFSGELVINMPTEGEPTPSIKGRYRTRDVPNVTDEFWTGNRLIEERKVNPDVEDREDDAAKEMNALARQEKQRRAAITKQKKEEEKLAKKAAKEEGAEGEEDEGENPGEEEPAEQGKKTSKRKMAAMKKKQAETVEAADKVAAAGLALLLTLFVASPAVVFLWWKGWKFVADALFRLRQNGTDPADNSHAVRPLASNMNGEYELDDAAKDFETSFAKRGMEFFDVYSPVIATRYAEVYWTELGNLELPVEIRKRFEDGAIAITGYEHDQVFADDLEKSVPFSWAYNHHYVVYMTADRMGYEVLRKDAVRKWARGKMSSEGDPGGADDENGSPLGGGDETHLGLHHMGVFISEANGGESRKSLHSYPDGFAQIVEQPRYWHVTPMQVDSRNRDCGVAPADVGGTCESLGIEPRQAAWGGRVPHAERKVTGLIECPCTSRFGGDPAVYGQETKTKSFRQQFAVEALDQCARDTIIDGGDGGADPAKGAAECFDAASKLLTGQAGQKLVIRNVTTPGMAMAIEDATGYALFDFGPKYNVTVQIDLNATHADLRLTGPANVWFGLAFNAVLMADQPYTILVLPRGSATAADDEHETETESDKTNKADIVEQQIGTCGEEAQHCPGDRLKQQSLVVLEDRFQGHNERRVRVVRSLQGVTAKHYSFGEVGVDGKTKPGPATINLMAAVGRSPVFAHHKAHRRKQIALLDRGKGKFNCVCYDKRTPGLLCDSKGQQCESFVKNCAPPCSAATTFPTLSFGASAAAASAAAPGFHQHCGDLIPQRNPTCASRTYVGGLQCCRHGSILLDADQADRPEKLCYRMKFRFWYKEMQPPASSSESVGPLSSSAKSGMYLIWANGHCHAPSCISMELFRNDTGQLLCRQEPRKGTGSGFPDPDRFDEEGYVFIPPCIWTVKQRATSLGRGAPKPEGGDTLPAAPFIPEGVVLRSVKRNRNTANGHFGEMASWQMRAVRADALVES